MDELMPSLVDSILNPASLLGMSDYDQGAKDSNKKMLMDLAIKAAEFVAENPEILALAL